VISTITQGEDREIDTVYRRRVLTRIRAQGGGGNAADYRQWSEDVASVRRAFPYSTKPSKSTDVITTLVFAVAPTNTITWAAGDWADDLGAVIGDQMTITGTASNDGTYTITAMSDARDVITVTGPLAAESPASTTVVIEPTPGDRTVYIESTDTGVDGVPTAAILAAVRAALLNDPDTGDSRDVLGTTEERLYVEPIVRLEVDVRINGLVVASEIETSTKAQIVAALTAYLYDRVFCFVDGLDFDGDRSDSITEMVISGVVKDVLKPVGATADDIQIRVGAGAATTYLLGRGELAIIDAVTYDAW
jgi:hypothetical protein